MLGRAIDEKGNCMKICIMSRNRDGFYVFTVDGRSLAVINQLGRTHSAHNGKRMRQTAAQKSVDKLIARLFAMDIRLVEPGVGVGSEYQYIQSLLSSCYPD